MSKLRPAPPHLPIGGRYLFFETDMRLRYLPQPLKLTDDNNLNNPTNYSPQITAIQNAHETCFTSQPLFKVGDQAHHFFHKLAAKLFTGQHTYLVSDYQKTNQDLGELILAPHPTQLSYS